MAGFKEIIGHKREIAHLTKAMEAGKVSHAYIFSGAKGTGKLTLADAFAMALQCTGEGERPCGSCHSCQQAASGNHPDIIHLTHEKPNSIGVEDVREQLVGDVQHPGGGEADGAGAERDPEDDRGAAGVCDHFAAHDKRAELSRHDPFQMRAAAAQACAG